ncbi:MAG: DUF167 domain-containing protein [Coriobacteriales bacterium]|nr:DUF167 domain-containing protein [Coriobacteriales bacterium]
MSAKEQATTIPIRVTPKAQSNAVLGVAVDDADRSEVCVRVTAAPEGGKANKAVCEAVAKSLGIAKGKVCVVRGETSRHKMVEVDLDEKTVESWIEGLPRV